MIMPKFWCHEYMRQVPCTHVFWALLKINLSFISFMLPTNLSLYGQMEGTEFVNQSSCMMGIIGKTLKIELLQTFFVIEDFGST